MPEPDVAHRLLDAAARLLGEEGPAALSTRRLAAEAGTSTMAVYTHFGSLPSLVREVVADGFAQLQACVAAVASTEDPLDDLARVAEAYRAQATAHPQLYAVMFGSASLGGYRLQADELDVGLEAFGELVAVVQRAMDSGALRDGDAAAVSGQLWCALHGYVMLELSGFNRVVDDPARELLGPMFAHLVGALAAP